MPTTVLERERVRSIVGAFFDVYNYYGYGLSEAVYSRALEIELIARGHEVMHELLVPISYKGQFIKWQRIDMVVDCRIVVENKARERLPPADFQQLRTYLRATIFQVGLLLHFGPVPKFYRAIDFPKSRYVMSASSHSSHSSNS